MDDNHWLCTEAAVNACRAIVNVIGKVLLLVGVCVGDGGEYCEDTKCGITRLCLVNRE